MENEILAQILATVQKLDERQSNMERQQIGMAEELMAFQEFTMQKFTGLENRFTRLEGRFDGLENRFDGLENRFNGLENRFNGLENRFTDLENMQRRTNLIIENEIRPSIQALAEGQMVMQRQLDRIEEKVTAHEEIIFKRVK